MPRPENDNEKNSVLYDKSTFKVIAIACVMFVLTIFFMGGISYFIAQDAIVAKLKSRDLVYIVDSIADKIDSRIERAKETSLIMARDPFILSWVKGGEKDDTLGEPIRSKLQEIAKLYDYSNTFVVSAVTHQYWGESGKAMGVMTEDNPLNAWFFEALESKKQVFVNLDYSDERKKTFVFVDVLMGEIANPVGVAGVGLDLNDVANEFQSYKRIEKSNLWLIDRSGKILLAADVNHNGKNITDFIPEAVKDNMLLSLENSRTPVNVTEYKDESGLTFDLACKSMRSTDLKLVFQLPRSESISVLQSIKTNTLFAGAVALILAIIIFYLISYKIANPYKRALLLTNELETKVSDRTRELAEQNTKIIDSINYAKRIQESVLPAPQELTAAFKESFVIWKPRDIVGGDFYWLRRRNDEVIIAVGDCTGHGVPGALMTMTSISILNQIYDEVCNDDPALILKELNIRLKQTLYQGDNSHGADDGLDIGICHIKGSSVVFSGAKISLFISTKNEVNELRGDRRSIGYQRSDGKWEFTSNSITVTPDTTLYFTTDGYIDQNGGEKDYSLGKKRLRDVMAKIKDMPLTKQKAEFETALTQYMADEAQRDDITVVGFKI
ncbi:SpoIIE family protein phosphatase [Dendrosporobacter sp. 1207_IL3150]|uniref:SpoIIE family protein phosphatase n=1 Tax=Dendrosporobacter sp. 1207_IL3150 TaxID=3084054 RepID=UPI002FDA89B3